MGNCFTRPFYGSYGSSKGSDDRPQREQGGSSKAAPGQQSGTFWAIPDKYRTVEEVQVALRDAGLEASQLIMGIDYTKSNTWTGKRCFNGRCLHETSGQMNPYQTAIQIIGKTLEAFDDDKVIPTYGFGDLSTADKAVFSFYADRHPVGFEEVLRRYSEITPGIVLSGPTDFAPIINRAIETVQQEREYHILVIIADGQVTSEAATKAAIVRASAYPLSIIVIGVGDGPWEVMEEFDDGLPTRKFDNFQFVEFDKVYHEHPDNFEAAFAVMALMEIPDQYLEIRKLGLLNNFASRAAVPLPVPVRSVATHQAPYDTSYPPGFAQPAVASEHHLGPHYSAPPSSRQLEMATAPAQVATLFGHPPESARGTATSFAVPVGQHVPPVAMPAVMPYNMPAAMPATFDHFHGPNSGRV